MATGDERLFKKKAELATGDERLFKKKAELASQEKGRIGRIGQQDHPFAQKNNLDHLSSKSRRPPGSAIHSKLN